MDPMIVAMSDDGQFRVRLRKDPSASDPREFSDDVIVYTVTVPNRDHIDVAGAGPLSEAWEQIKDRDDAVTVFQRYAASVHKAVTLHDAPHDGPEVIWYMLPDGMAQVSDPMTYMEAERDEYRAWASGEVYGYVIEEAVDWAQGDGQNGSKSTWEPLDGDDEMVWGLAGYEVAALEAKREFSAFLQCSA